MARSFHIRRKAILLESSGCAWHCLHWIITLWRVLVTCVWTCMNASYLLSALLKNAARQLGMTTTVLEWYFHSDCYTFTLHKYYESYLFQILGTFRFLYSSMAICTFWNYSPFLALWNLACRLFPAQTKTATKKSIAFPRIPRKIKTFRNLWRIAWEWGYGCQQSPISLRSLKR